MAVNTIVPQLASYILGADDEIFDTVPDKYFLPQHKDIVKQVFRNTANEELWGDIFIVGEDWQNQCATGFHGNPVLSYTTLQAKNGCPLDSQMHFCTSPLNAFNLPGVQDIKCLDLKPELKISKKMASFDGWLASHEFMHLREITESVLQDINPPFGSIADIVYGPVSVRKLRQDASRAHQAILNADSYALFAMEMYFTLLCASMLRNNGMKYFKEPDSDQWTD